MSKRLKTLLVAMASLLAPASTQAQIAATVAVNASPSTTAIPPTAFGTNVGCGDNEMYGPNVTLALKGSAGTQQVNASAPSTAAGKTITFHVGIPPGSAISSIQAFAQQDSAGNWTWTGNWQLIGSLKTNAWNTLTVTVPSNAATPLNELGIQFTTSGTWTGTCYVDSVRW